MFLLITLLVILSALTYYYKNSRFNYWKIRNVPHPQPHFLFGNIKNSVLMRRSVGQDYSDLYDKFPDFPYVGFYKIRKPGILLRDAELIHNIAVKDFGSFNENDFKVDEKYDPLEGRNPAFLAGDRWKVARNQVTVCFTSGKLRTMIPLMENVAQKMVDYINKNINLNKSTIETKELCTKFTIDNVANCGFGLDGKTFDDENSELRNVAKVLCEPSTIHGIKMLLLTFLPSIAHVVRAKFVPDEVEDYIRKMVSSVLSYREQNRIVRNDLLEIVNQIRKDNFSFDDVAAHAFSFFEDGFETCSITISFALYELAANPRTQLKAREEIKSVLKKYDGVISYDSIKEMEYLHCVMCESLRLHPPGMTSTKKCTTPYELPPINGNKKGLIIEVGTPVIIPTYAIQREPKYWKNPESFQPERFLDENKNDIVSGTWIPFGEGPRACLGQRFAMLQVKVALASILNNFELTVNEKTKVPLEYDKRYFRLVTTSGLWINFNKIK
nr:cytochrome P450 6j1-like [Onthophagus taurus]